MELIELFTSLNGMGFSPFSVALMVFLWKQDKRLTIMETILRQK